VTNVIDICDETGAMRKLLSYSAYKLVSILLCKTRNMEHPGNDPLNLVQNNIFSPDMRAECK
jgi:hypothetical protein